MSAFERQRELASLEKSETKDFLACLTVAEREQLEEYWPLWARREQMPPPGRGGSG